MKKILSIALVLVLALGCMTFAYASDPESTPFDTAVDFGTVTSTSVSKSGTLASSSAVDYYKFTTASSGLLTAALTKTSGTGIAVQILASDKTTISGSFTAAESATSESKDFSLAAGTYYVLVSNSDSFINGTYSLALSIDTSGTYETEPNNAIYSTDKAVGEANALTFTNNVTEEIKATASDTDIDYYKVRIVTNGYIYPVVKKTSSSDDAKITVKVHAAYKDSSSSANGVVAEYSSTSNGYIDNPKVYCGYTAVNQGYYYISVEADKTSNYILSVYFKSGSGYEAEYNDNTYSSNIVKPTDYVGSFFYGKSDREGDSDFFKLDLSSSDKNYSMTVKTTEVAKVGTWKVEVLKSDASTSVKTASMYFGNDFTVSLSDVLGEASSGTYYVRISPVDYSDATYKITFTKNEEEEDDSMSWDDVWTQFKAYFNTFLQQWKDLISLLDLKGMLSTMATQITKIIVNLSL